MRPIRIRKRFISSSFCLGQRINLPERLYEALNRKCPALVSFSACSFLHRWAEHRSNVGRASNWLHRICYKKQRLAELVRDSIPSCPNQACQGWFVQSLSYLYLKSATCACNYVAWDLNTFETVKKNLSWNQASLD